MCVYLWTYKYAKRMAYETPLGGRMQWRSSGGRKMPAPASTFSSRQMKPTAFTRVKLRRFNLFANAVFTMYWTLKDLPMRFRRGLVEVQTGSQMDFGANVRQKQR
jgi:hypothetical protein